MMSGSRIRVAHETSGCDGLVGGVQLGRKSRNACGGYFTQKEQRCGCALESERRLMETTVNCERHVQGNTSELVANPLFRSIPSG